MRPAWYQDWTWKTAVILASGPSLTVNDVTIVERARFWGNCKVIAVNSTFRRAPFSDVIYACDPTWWRGNVDAVRCRGLKVMARVGDVAGLDDPLPSVCIRDSGTTGLETEPPFVAAGGNSGHQAINLALQFGANRVLLLGFDFMSASDGRKHWHPDHVAPMWNPSPDLFKSWQAAMETIPAALGQFGAEIINCSRQTAISCLPRSTIDAEL